MTASRRLRAMFATGAVALCAIVAAVPLARRSREASAPLRLPPVLVEPPIRLPGAIVLGAARGWHLGRTAPPALGDPVPVVLTAYCLSGTTRRGRYVRPGIVAADPRFFPLARYVELYVGRRYLGRFLVDDTGDSIRGPRLDVWVPTCREARLFGRQRGTAVLAEK